MEGGGEGMVAVVQGMRDAGLTVTLLGRPRKTLVDGAPGLDQLALAKSSVETSTSGLPFIPSVDRAAQICDGRYTSSYQLAHCRALPSSPLVETAEFPPQRPEPSRALGNFEISGIGSNEARPYICVKRLPNTLRDSYTCVERGVLLNSQVSRCSEAFAHSLRRYPSLSPNSSVSSDLVQRLLVYTQAKNFTKSSCHSRSLRSLRNKKSEFTKETLPKTKESRSVQTYTRAKREKKDVPPTNRDRQDKERRVSNSREKNDRSPKKCRSRSPPDGAKNLRPNHSVVDATYDYLNCSSCPFSQSADVRYLTDVTRCLRDTIRQICDDTPVVCPNMQNRYSRHRREHHRQEIGVESSSDNNNVEAQASSPMASIGVPIFSSCEAVAGTYQQTCPNRPKYCCYCRNALPCACKSSRYSLDSQGYARYSKDAGASNDFPKQLDEAVTNWLKEIPVFANENNEDKVKREEMAEGLVNKLKQLKGDPDFEEKANAEIAKCVKNMPMWCPENIKDQNAFKQRMVDNLVGKVTDLSKDKDKFRDEITKWVEGLNFIKTDSQGSIDKRDVVDNFMNRLKPLALNPPADLKKALQDEIVDILEELPIKVNGEKSVFINQLADNLATKLKKTPAKSTSESLSVDLEDEFQKEIFEWLRNIPEFSSPKSENLKKRVKSFAKKLQKIDGQSISKSQKQHQMNEAINEWLEENADQRDLDSKTKKQLADKLSEQLVEASQKVHKSKRGQPDDYHENTVQEISNWLKNIPELYSSSNKVENRKMAENLAKKLQELRIQDMDESELKEEIADWLNTSFENNGQHLNAIKRDNLANKLLCGIKKIPVQQAKDEESHEKVVQEIANWLKNIPEISGGKVKTREMAENLANELQELRSQGKDDSEIEEKIADWLTTSLDKEDKHLDTKDQENLVNKLLGTINKIPIVSKKQEGNKKMVEEIANWLNNIPELSQGSKAEQRKMVDNLAQKLQVLKKQGKDESEIQEEIADWLASAFEKKGEHLGETKLNKLVDKLLDGITQISVVSTNDDENRDKMVEEIAKCIKSIPEISGGNKATSREMAQNLANKFQKLRNQGKTDSEIEEEIADWLKKSFENKGEHLDTKTQNNLVNKLLGRLTKIPAVTAPKRTMPSGSNDAKNNEKVLSEVNNWLKNIPELSSGSRAENQKLTDDLAYKIQNLRNQGKDESEIEEEIADWLTTSFENKGEYLDTRTQENLVNKLLGRINKLPAVTSNNAKLVDEISNWFKGIPELSGSKAENQKMAGDLAEKLQILKNQGKDESEIKAEIADWLSTSFDNKGELINRNNQDNLVNKLMRRINKSPSMLRMKVEKSKKKIIDDISNWLENIPALSGGSTIEKQKQAENLANQIQRLRNQGKDESEIREEIADWLTSSFENKGEHLDLRTQDNLVKKLLGRINKSPTVRMGPSKIDERISEEISDWLEDIPELSSVNKTEKREMIETLAKNLRNLKAQGKGESEFESEIENWLTDTFENKGKYLDKKSHDKMVNKLLGRINKLPVIKQNLAQNILDCFDDVPEFDMSLRKNKKFVDQLANKIQALQSQNQGKADQTEIKEEISTWITNLMESSGAELDREAKKELVEKLTNVAALSAPKQRKRWSKQEDPMKLMSSLREEVGDVLDKSKIPFENRNEIESILTDILADQVMRGEDEEQIRNRLTSALEDSNLSPEQSDEIADKLADMAKEMSLMYKTQDSTLISDRGNLTLSLMQKDIYEENAQREILGFIEEISGDASPLPRKSKAAAQKLAEKVTEILSNTESMPDDKRDNIENEISKYLKDFPIQTDVPIHKQASQLADRLRNLAFKTSTPKRPFDQEVSFRPQRDSTGRTISAIDNISQMMQTQAPSKEEQKYSGQLSNIINSWISKLPIDLDSGEGKGFKDVMIKDLTGDIIDRQKYLQLNPGAKTSDEEELEHLKYQVFRWLNKLPDVKNLMPSIAKTDDLMNRIKAVSVPQLIKSPEKGSSASSVQHLSKDFASLQNEIQKWFEAIPSKYITTKDKNYQREMAKDLAEHIDQLRKGNALTEPEFTEIISEWLDNVLKEANKRYVSSLTEGLKGVLVNKNLMTLNQPDRTQDTRKISISADGIKDAILKWSQKLPFLPGKSIENAMKDVDLFSSKVKALTSVTPEKVESIKTNLENEIKAFLNKLPIQKNKLTDNHAEQLGNQIDELITKAKMTTESMTSNSGLKKAADVLYENIENWCKNLPIREGETPEEKEKAKTLKQNIASKLINVIGDLNIKPEIFNDDSLYEDVLRDEIDNIFSSLPPSPELKNNLPALKDNLIAKVKEARSKSQDELAGQAYKQQVRDAISKTLPSVDSLPTEEQAPFEVLKDDLADAYIELHHAAENDEVKAKLKKKISDEINQFCDDYLKRYPLSPVDPHRLNRELYNVLQNIPTPKDETIKNQVEQMRIKDEINDWLQDLPLKDDETPTEKLQRNKIVTYLAKRLHDIEKEKELNPEVDVADRLQTEIKKWIKKLPIKPGEEENVDQMVQQLTNKLKDSEESRRLSISHIRHSVDSAEDDGLCDLTCPNYSKFYKPRPCLPTKCMSQYAPPFPASTLSTEDRAHLQRIRERNEGNNNPCIPSYSPCFCKDASVSPLPMDTGSQTDVVTQPCQSASTRLAQQASRTSPCLAEELTPCSQVNQPNTPHIIVREYYWDSPETNRDTNGVPCTSSEEQGYPRQYEQPCPRIPQDRFESNSQQACLPPVSSILRQAPCMQPSAPRLELPRPCTQSPKSCSQPPPCMTPRSSNRQHVPSMQSSATRMKSPPCRQPPTCQQPSQIRVQPPPPCRQSFHPCMPTPTCKQPQYPCVSESSPQPSFLQPQFTEESQRRSCFIRPSPQPSMTPQRSPYQMPPCMPPPRPCIPEPSPCMVQPPCMSPSQSVKPPCMSQPRTIIRPGVADSPFTLPRAPCMQRPPCRSRWRERKRNTGHQSCTPDLTSSSPFDTECPEAGASSFAPRVTRLGSLDDVPRSRTCGSQSPRGRRTKGSPNEDCDWTISFPDDTDFWGTPCTRRKIYRSPQKDGSVFKEKERREEKMRCRCRERVLTKCVRPAGCRDDDTLRHCPQCCGTHCPHPSYLFFR